MRKIAVILFALLLAACQKQVETATISGQLYGVPSQTLLLELVLPEGTQIIDTTTTSSDGSFSFNVECVGDDYPKFHNIRLNDQFIPLLIDKGENIQVEAVGNIYNNYTVKGSKGSDKLHEFIRLTVDANIRIDSIQNLYNNSTDYFEKTELGKENVREHNKLKRNTINFILKNASSLVSIVPLYQMSYSGILVFNEPSDIVFYRAIADSLSKTHPHSPYVISLVNDVNRINRQQAIDDIIASSMENVTSFPNLIMKDAKGETHELANLRGRTILLSFTSTNTPELKILNRELLDLYNRYNEKGLEIYEVSIDTDKVKWLQSITENRLPWIQVCDFMGDKSPSLGMYNVKGLPQYFLISPEAEIVYSHLQHNQLEKAVKFVMMD